jgi:uncharacterized protein YhaN
MRIESFHIDGFGLFHDTHLELSPHLSVFCGANESGKSTLLAFLRFMFFGFPDKRTSANRYPPFQAGAPHGGSVTLRTPAGIYCVERHDSLQLLKPDGAVGTAEDLQTLLNGLTRETFFNIFAFSLRELQGLHDAFEQGTVREAIYGAVTGVNHQLMMKAEEYLEDGLARIFKPRSKKATINTALGGLDQVQQEIRDTENDLSAFEQLSGEISSLELVLQAAQTRQHELDSEIDRLKQRAFWVEQLRNRQSEVTELTTAHAQLRHSRSEIRLNSTLLQLSGELKSLLKARDQLVALQRKKPELQEAVDFVRHELSGSFVKLGPEWTPERIDSFRVSLEMQNSIRAIEADLRKAEVRIAEGRAIEAAEIEHRKVALQEERTAAEAFERVSEPPPPLDGHLFDRLRAGQLDYERATQDLRAREGELRAAEDVFRQSMAEVHPRWTEDDLQRFDTSLAARQELQSFGDRLSRTRQQWGRAQEQISETAYDSQQAKGRDSQEPEKPNGSRWLSAYSATVGVALLVGISIWFWHPILGSTIAGSSVLLATVLFTRVLLHRRQLAEQIEQAKKVTIEANQLLARRREALREAETRLEQEKDAWRGHLGNIGLPVSLSPEDAIVVVSRVDVCRERLNKVETLRHRIGAMEQNRQQYLDLFNELLAARGQAAIGRADVATRLPQFVASIHAEDELRKLRQTARELSMTASEKRRGAEDALLKATRSLQQAIEKQQDLTAAWRQWLDQNGLPSHLLPTGAMAFLQDLDSARDLLGRVHALDLELRKVTEEEMRIVGRLNNLLASSGRPSAADPVADLDSMAAALQSAESDAQVAAVFDARIAEKNRQLEAKQSEMQEAEAQVAQIPLAWPDVNIQARQLELSNDSSKLKTEIQDMIGKLVGLRTRHQAMATDERLSKLHEQRAAYIEQIRQLARQWAVLSFARTMFDQARKRYEEERQPAVVRRASAHLRCLTRDRYREVRMPLDRSELQVLPSEAAAPKTTDQLSRGTAEQLYLALRFGFIEEFTGDRSPLPIIMDDTLVNSDPSRVTAAIETLIRISEQFQILYFTCHPETVTKFRAADTGIPVIDLADGHFSITLPQESSR